jgi:hypothetical protein
LLYWLLILDVCRKLILLITHYRCFPFRRQNHAVAARMQSIVVPFVNSSIGRLIIKHAHLMLPRLMINLNERSWWSMYESAKMTRWNSLITQKFCFHFPDKTTNSCGTIVFWKFRFTTDFIWWRLRLLFYSSFISQIKFIAVSRRYLVWPLDTFPSFTSSKTKQ